MNPINFQSIDLTRLFNLNHFDLGLILIENFDGIHSDWTEINRIDF